MHLRFFSKNQFCYNHGYDMKMANIGRDLRFHDLTIGPVSVRFHAIFRSSGSSSYSYAKLIYHSGFPF